MPRRTHPTQLTGLRQALAAEYRDLMGLYWPIAPEMHDRYVAHILSGAELRLHRWELDAVPLPAGSADDVFILTADDELQPV